MPRIKRSTAICEITGIVSDVAMPKFKVVKVHSFRYKDKRYAQGETVDLSDEDARHFAKLDFLEPIEEEPKKPEKLQKGSKA